jgi:predicted nucleic acid-binding protein
MKKVFADTGYWIALLNPNDELHLKARSVTASLSANADYCIAFRTYETGTAIATPTAGIAMRCKSVKLINLLGWAEKPALV